LNNFLGPESDPVTVATQLPSTKYSWQARRGGTERTMDADAIAQI
jgi:hypothetical protein